MVATRGRRSGEPLPALQPDGEGEPTFTVQFSRPDTRLGLIGTPANSFRWTGKGMLRLQERGVVVTARRRYPFGLYRADERFVPGSEIRDVYREGSVVRVHLRDAAPGDPFFQFWAENAATAATIVRLLPTTRTIEFEDSAGGRGTVRMASYPVRRSALWRTRLWLGGVAALVAGIWLAAHIAGIDWRGNALETGSASLPATTQVVATATFQDPGSSAASIIPTPAPPSTPVELESLRMELEKFDSRLDGLKQQFGLAFSALQEGRLSRDNFIAGVEQWLIPQWESLQDDLASISSPPGSLRSALLQQFGDAAAGWKDALNLYTVGLRDEDVATVEKALNRMQHAEESQQNAGHVFDQAVFGESLPP